VQSRHRIRASISDANEKDANQTASKACRMTEREDRLARERAEIAARVASFRATQEKFRRERDEYFATTLEKARHGTASQHILERTQRWP